MTTTYHLGRTAAELGGDGESFAVDLANTLYGAPEVVVDHLADPASTAAWFGATPAAADLDLPARWTDRDLDRLRALRDATRRVLLDIADGGTARPADCAALSSAAALSAWELVLTVGADRPEASLRPPEGHRPHPLAQVAVRCLLLVGSAEVRRARRCASPRCSMLFTQGHRSRRYCDPACAHGQRQSRYYRSSRRTSP